MDTKDRTCPNPECHLHQVEDQDNIHIHSRKEKRFRCHECGKTFALTHGTLFYRRQYDQAFITAIVTLLAFRCPVQAIVAAFSLDERTVVAWQDAAGQQARAVHEQLIEQNGLDLQQVQADEIRVKAQGCVLWMAMAIMVPTRLWLGGVVSQKRDKYLVRDLAKKVRACALCRPLLIVFDGFSAYVDAFQKAFRSPLHTGKRGQPRLIPWPKVVLVRVIKKRTGRKLKGISRVLVQAKQRIFSPYRLPEAQAALAQQLLESSQGGGVFNTSYIERINGTFRSRLAALVRRGRDLLCRGDRLERAMYLVGSVYNFCCFHESLRLPLYVRQRDRWRRRWVGRTPTMAAGLTDHRWSVLELLSYKVGPPTVLGQEHVKRPKRAVLALAA